MTETFTMLLDKRSSPKLHRYDLYRSQEMKDGRPVIDGLYVQWGYFDTTPERLLLTLELPKGEG